MPPYLRAAISCGDRGRDLRRSFCRRFWNHICIRISNSFNNANAPALTDLDLLLVE